MKQKETMRKRAVLALGAAVYALLFALCSQIDQTGSVAAGTAAVRFVLALPVSLGVLWALFAHVFPWLEIKTSRNITRGGYAGHSSNMAVADHLLRRDVPDSLSRIVHV